MSSLTNINNNSSVVNVGRTTPVSPGPQPASQSIPVVMASDQTPIPVIEQQKIQSEVALSMLGIPRSEVALGIFSDVNTYDVNPTEWSSFPEEYKPGWGVKHLPQEAGAMIQSPKDELAILSSKRFFRYQPGRVSAATFGVKASESPRPNLDAEQYDINPAIRKYGIFDKFDGYYWETRGDATGDNFVINRRTQALLNINPVEFSNATSNQDDYRIVGKAAASPVPETNREPRALEIIRDQFFDIIETAYTAAIDSFAVDSVPRLHLENNRTKCERDAAFALNAYILDIQYGGTGHTITNATTYRTALGPTTLEVNSAGADDRRTAENELHFQIGEALAPAAGVGGALEELITVNGVARATRIAALVNIIRTAVGDGAVLGAQPALADRTSTSTTIWARNKFKTVFSIYKKYLGYLISEAFIPGSGGGVTADYTLDDYKFKCLRDVGYIVDGYGKDLGGGGNAATVYNMKNFYFNGQLKLFSIFGPNYSPVAFHRDAHTLLQRLISNDVNILAGDTPNATRWNIANLVGFTPVFNYFGFGASKTRFDNELAGPVIANFTVPYTGRMDFGTEAQYGDLITLRDGLIHIHAGVYDPSLLKERKQVRVKINVTNNTLQAAEGEFVVDQVINFIGDAGGMTSNKFYAVKSVSGQLSNIITIYDPTDENRATIDITSIGTDNFIEPNVPFIFPNVYQKGTTTKAGDPSPSIGSPWRKYDGMFPYMYASADGSLDTNFADKDENGNTRFEGLPLDGDMTGLYTLGYINPAIDTTSNAYQTLREQIDTVNFRYNNWIKQNVDPKYYAVYEYRIPRSYFSTDKLDGETRRLIYSDVAIGDTDQGVTKVRPGQNFIKDTIPQSKSSVWNIDLTKVTMLKIEFSWYGAVGALFLAYVPVSNDEARWVRVHHLRASNQLKISSLGNATLPITYLTYGGGSPSKGGIDELPKSYGSTSNHIVKYGASYYIDGGDRGTVRLYSHTNLLPATVYGRAYTIGTVAPLTDAIGTYITIPDALGPTDKSFFMKAQISTASNQDQGVKVIWVDNNQPADQRRLYLSKSLVNNADVRVIANRPSITFGLKAKQAIFNSEGTGIRNRVQVYPTKMSTANFATVPMTLEIVKTPIFQSTFVTNGEFILEAPSPLVPQYIITPENEPLPVVITSDSYLRNDGDFVYGWFIANVGTVFGKLYRVGGSYYFELRDVFAEEVKLFVGIPFLKDGRFGPKPGSALTPGFEEIITPFEVTTQKERLSSVFISNVSQSPIPDTGGIVTSFFLSPGSDQFDLLSYFDYNKDYLSFPLTDEVNSIYLAASLSGESTTNSQINTSITWEEQ